VAAGAAGGEGAGAGTCAGCAEGEGEGVGEAAAVASLADGWGGADGLPLPLPQLTAAAMIATTKASNAKRALAWFLDVRPGPPGRVPGVGRRRPAGVARYRDGCGLRVFRLPMCPPTMYLSVNLPGKTSRTAENWRPARQERPARPNKGLPSNEQPTSREGKRLVTQPGADSGVCG
jgi:hypothetical protein